jgi:hypothetical protein
MAVNSQFAVFKLAELLRLSGDTLQPGRDSIIIELFK